MPTGPLPISSTVPSVRAAPAEAKRRAARPASYQSSCSRVPAAMSSPSRCQNACSYCCAFNQRFHPIRQPAECTSISSSNVAHVRCLGGSGRTRPPSIVQLGNDRCPEPAAYAEAGKWPAHVPVQPECPPRTAAVRRSAGARIVVPEDLLAQPGCCWPQEFEQRAQPRGCANRQIAVAVKEGAATGDRNPPAASGCARRLVEPGGNLGRLSERQLAATGRENPRRHRQPVAASPRSAR